MNSWKKEKILNLPNLLTMLRLLMVPVFIAVFSKGFLTSAMIIYILAFLTDVLDGKIARKYNIVTDFGKLMDPLADKLMLISALICLCVKGWVSLAVAVIVGSKELFMVVGGTLLLHRRVVVQASWIGKCATGVFLVAIVTTFFHPYTQPYDLVIQWIAVLLSLCAVVWYTTDVLRNLNKSEKEA